MKKIKHLMIWIGLLLSLVSCKDTMEAIGLGGDEIPAEGLVLTLQLTNFTKQQIGTRAESSEKFNSLCAVFYGDNNEYLGKADCSSTLKQQPDGSSYKVKITNVPAGTKNVHLVANASDMTESEAQDLQSLTAAKERDPQLDAPICWGKISIDKLLEANPSVTMLRQCAKISLEIDNRIQSNFTNAGLYVYNMATKAAIAPANYTELTTTDDLAESTALRTNPLGGGTATTVAVNETSAGKAMVIIKANYKDSEGHDREGYYKVALYKNDKKAQYALLRNHHYTIKVTKVNDYGFSTLDEAKKSLPENRLEVEVVDDNPEITQMIACKDYELGVSDYQEVDASTEEAFVTIVTTLPNATSSDGKLYGVKRNAPWITKWDPLTENDTPVPGRKSSKGKKYTLKLTLTKNDQSENSRTGTITITSGDLSLDITIKQAGFDFRRKDPKRNVTMQYNDSPVAANYFKWLDEDVKGITPEEMQGAVRNDGLHFCVGTADITYLIPKLEGDEISKKDNKINVEEVNGKWKVSLANTTANEDLWKASFTIKNQADIEITYPVYHTGIFHKIDESSKAYTDYQLAKNGDNTKKVKGWFYYGVVKVQGKKADGTTTTYYMLDRNLGASNNGYYAPDVVALEKNEKAIGGYFCISEKKSTSDATQDLSSTLAPTGYTIPTDAVFEELVNAGNLEVVPQSTSLGETYNCVRIKTVDSELPYIYLPMGGFLEGENHKNPIHVNLWTKTLLSGTQGFSTTSPEYGFWYRYFDVYNKRKGLSNMRFVSGSNGKNNGRYRAMPIRLILKSNIR